MRDWEQNRSTPDQAALAYLKVIAHDPEFGRQWAQKIFLGDDPLVPARERRRSKKAGEFGWVKTPRTKAGVEFIDVKMRLKEQADF